MNKANFLLCWFCANYPNRNTDRVCKVFRSNVNDANQILEKVLKIKPKFIMCPFFEPIIIENGEQK